MSNTNEKDKIIIIDEDFYLSAKIGDQIEKVFNDNEINNLRHLSLHSFVMSEGEVSAALFLSNDINEFDFSLAVTPSMQGRGIGSKLMDLAFDAFNEIRDINPSIETSITVLHPFVRNKMFENDFLPIEGERYSSDLSVFSHQPLSPKELVSKFGNKKDINLMSSIIEFCKENNPDATFPEIVIGLTSVLEGREVSTNIRDVLYDFSESMSSNDWRGEFLTSKLNSTLKNEKPRYLPENLSGALDKSIRDDSAVLFNVLLKSIKKVLPDEDPITMLSQAKDDYFSLLKKGGVSRLNEFPLIAFEATESMGFPVELKSKITSRLEQIYNLPPFKNELALDSKGPSISDAHSTNEMDYDHPNLNSTKRR